MGRSKDWVTVQTGRAPMYSPGRPGVNQRPTKQAFWKFIAAGLSSEDAAQACGVSQPLGPRWFREAGGLPPMCLTSPSGRYLSFSEREEIALMHAQQQSLREIARRPGRSPSTISRDLRRNAATRGGTLQYRATVAQWKAEMAAQRPKSAKLALNQQRELSACLRTGRALRVPRARTQQRGKSFITPEVMISERPAEATDRAVPGHWEGDLIIGLNSSAIGTLVERSSRFTILLHLPPMAGHEPGVRLKHGPATAGHGAEAVRSAIATKLTTLPTQLSRTLTWDQGAEMAQHVQLRIETGLAIYFCDPRSPWQRGTNENTNGLLRQYFPKGTDISRYTERELDAVAATLNSRPRKTLGWKTPAEVLSELLSRAQKTCVATTP